MKTPTFPGLLQSFFVEHLVRQRNASPNTVAGYRDSFRLLLQFAAEHCGKVPSHLDMSDLDSPFIGAFLDHLEKDRGCCARTRNARLAAIHAFFRYVAMREPAYALVCQRVLAIPTKRHEREVIAYLAPPETEALLAAPDLSTRIGRRDRALLLLAVQTRVALASWQRC